MSFFHCLLVSELYFMFFFLFPLIFSSGHVGFHFLLFRRVFLCFLINYDMWLCGLLSFLVLVCEFLSFLSFFLASFFVSVNFII